ncbi:MAG: histidine phosphatase family protein [Cyanobacteria bacterium P01_A01_bin.114]
MQSVDGSIDGSMQIILIRHGQPQVSFPTWVSGPGFLQCVSAYQQSGLRSDAWPPDSAKRMMQHAQAVFTSDLPRAFQSARRLVPSGPIRRSSLFREPEFDSLSRFTSNAPLPFFMWALRAQLRWRVAALSGAASYQVCQAHIQAATHYLIEQANQAGTVALVGHSITHRLIAKELRQLGWRGPRVPNSSYWGYSLYSSTQPLASGHWAQNESWQILKQATFAPVEETFAQEGSTFSTQLVDDLDSSLREEIRRDRTFSLAEAIGREGADFLKGESTIPRPLRAIAQINGFIDQHLDDAEGGLAISLKAWVKDDARIAQHLDAPLTALQKILTSMVESEPTLYEFSRQVNVQWGQLYGEQPYFQAPGQPPHAKTAYPHGSVREALTQLLESLVSDR